jgi:hypothetical protein
MSEKFLEQLEQQIALTRVPESPVELRGAVLGHMNRELRASRWDRRLARAALALTAVAIGLNGTAGWQVGDSRTGPIQRVTESASRSSLVATAVVVAEATDAATARRFVQQLAAISGRQLTVDEVAAIDAAVRRPMSDTANGGKG